MSPGLIYTLVFIKSGRDILLGFKKRGLGKEKWNGFGGKVEKNETILEGAIRETKEESNLNVIGLKHIGVLAYEEKLRSKVDIVHVFTSNSFTDLLKESDEMKPEWFEVENIPYNQMWPDAKFWFPLMLKDKNFFAHVIYDDESTYKYCYIRELKSLDSVLESVKKMFPTFG